MTEEDFWLTEEFEDSIARGLIASFESRIARSDGAHPLDRLSEADLQQVRARGLYIPGKSRVVVGADDGLGFDRKIDPLPTQASILLPWDERRPGFYHGYCSIFGMQLLPKFPRGVFRLGAGDPFQLTCVTPGESEHIQGQKVYFSVEKSGRVVVAERRWLEGGDHQAGPRREVRWARDAPELASGLLKTAPLMLQFAADERHCWRIEAIERDASVRIGCQREEVKSLLYARDTPLTATGRKRPILHLVSAHRRRVRDGIEIDIDRFLRGTREVEMHGTLFRVHPPRELLKELQR